MSAMHGSCSGEHRHFHLQLRELYEYVCHRADSAPIWQITANHLSDAVNAYNMWLTYLERQDWRRADAAANRLDEKLKIAGDEMRRTADPALSDTIDPIRGELDSLRFSASKE